MFTRLNYWQFLGAVSAITAAVLLTVKLVAYLFSRPAGEAELTSSRVNVDGSSVQGEIIIEKNGTILVSQVLQFNFLEPRDLIRVFLPRFNPNPAEPAEPRRELHYEILDVRCDQAPTNAQLLDDAEAGKRWLIGVPGKPLPPGPHEYFVRYRVSNAVFFAEDADYLVWNLCGDWSISIPACGVLVRFPKLLESESVSVDTALVNASRGFDFSTPASVNEVQLETRDENSAAAVQVQALRPLRAHQRLIARFGWPKYFVTPGPSGQKTAT